jgi:hypothetical protein
MRKYVFVHLPKTGGTSFQLALRRVIGEDAVSPSFNASSLSEADAARLDQYPVISGHISMTDVARYFPDRMILTILREPLDRCVSWYYFARMASPAPGAPSDVLAAQQNDIEGFFGQPRQIIYRNIFNRQVRQLGDHVLNLDANHEDALDAAKKTISSAAWVGLQENLAADCAKLAKVFPETAGLHLEMSNQTPGRASMSELGQQLIASIRRFNEFDAALYNFARSELVRR